MSPGALVNSLHAQFIHVRYSTSNTHNFYTFQIPVLACIAVISAYYCGKRNAYSIHHFDSSYIINLRILITVCLVILPIIRAYIILTNTILAPQHPPNNNSMVHEHVMKPYTNLDTLVDTSDIIQQIKDGLNHTVDFTKSIFFPKNSIQTVTESSVTTNMQDYDPVLTVIKDNITSAKPIDYLVAGTEGLAWVVHLCFILSLKKGRDINPRGPVFIRALVFLLIVISILLLRSHIKHNPQDDVLPNLSLGFSISVVTLLVLYAVTLIPGHSSLRDMRSSQFNEVSYFTFFTSNIVVYNIISD